MTKLLITGANGYIGQYVLKEMEQQNIEFIATDINVDAIKNYKSSIAHDIFSDQDHYNILGRPDVLLHLAWRNGFIHNSDTHMSDLSQHYNFITQLIKSGVKKVCIIGSMHEIGYFEGMINEKTPPHPMTMYAIAKNTLRQSIELYCKKNDILFQWIRVFYIYGNNQYGNSIFSKLLQAARDGKKTFPMNSGKNKYDFISIDELAKQITAIVTQNKVTGIINSCSGVPVSLGEKVNWFVKENNLSIELQYGVFPEREYDSPEIWGDNTKIKEIMERRK